MKRKLCLFLALIIFSTSCTSALYSTSSKFSKITKTSKDRRPSTKDDEEIFRDAFEKLQGIIKENDLEQNVNSHRNSQAITIFTLAEEMERNSPVLAPLEKRLLKRLRKKIEQIKGAKEDFSLLERSLSLSELSVLGNIQKTIGEYYSKLIKEEQKIKYGKGVVLKRTIGRFPLEVLLFFAAGNVVCFAFHEVKDLSDPRCVNSELEMLTDARSTFHFFNFIFINSLYGAYSQLRTAPLPHGLIRPHTFMQRLFESKFNTYAGMALATIGASIITDVGWGIKDCTFGALSNPNEIKEGRRGAPYVSKTDKDQQLAECAALYKKFKNGKFFAHLGVDVVHILTAAGLAHGTTGAISSLRGGKKVSFLSKHLAVWSKIKNITLFTLPFHPAATTVAMIGQSIWHIFFFLGWMFETEGGANYLGTKVDALYVGNSKRKLDEVLELTRELSKEKPSSSSSVLYSMNEPAKATAPTSTQTSIHDFYNNVEDFIEYQSAWHGSLIEQEQNTYYQYENYMSHFNVVSEQTSSFYGDFITKYVDYIEKNPPKDGESLNESIPKFMSAERVNPIDTIRELPYDQEGYYQKKAYKYLNIDSEQGKGYLGRIDEKPDIAICEKIGEKKRLSDYSIKSIRFPDEHTFYIRNFYENELKVSKRNKHAWRIDGNKETVNITRKQLVSLFEKYHVVKSCDLSLDNCGEKHIEKLNIGLREAYPALTKANYSITLDSSSPIGFEKQCRILMASTFLKQSLNSFTRSSPWITSNPTYKKIKKIKDSLAIKNREKLAEGVLTLAKQIQKTNAFEECKESKFESIDCLFYPAYEILGFPEASDSYVRQYLKKLNEAKEGNYCPAEHKTQSILGGIWQIHFI